MVKDWVKKVNLRYLQRKSRTYNEACASPIKYGDIGGSRGKSEIWGRKIDLKPKKRRNPHLQDGP